MIFLVFINNILIHSPIFFKGKALRFFVIKLVFLVVFFSLIPTAFAQIDSSHDICKNVSDENPIAITTNTRYYEMGDHGSVFGCVLQETGIKEIVLTITLYDDLALEEKVNPDEDGFFSTDFVIDDKFRVAFWLVEASTKNELGQEGFVVTQRTSKSFFRTDDVESIINDQSWSNLTPKDISGDDKTLLLSGSQRIITMNLEDKTFQEIDIPIDLDKFEVISDLQFSKTSTDEIFFIFQNDIYKLSTKTGTAEKIVQDVEFFDLTSEDKIIYSTKGSNWFGSEGLFSLWSANSDGTDLLNIIENKKDINYFDLSPDDSKILFTKAVLREHLWDTFVYIYDLETKQITKIPELNIFCGPTPKWSPNGQLIVYSDASCDRHFPEAALHITDLDGNHGFLTDLEHSSSEYVVSNDGASVYYNLAPSGVYKMTLAQPIPEFETIAVMVLALTIIPLLLLRKFKCYRLFSEKLKC